MYGYDYMKKMRVINGIIEYIFNNLNYAEIELYNFLYENIESLSKELNITEDFIEDKLIDRESNYYIKIAQKIQNQKRLDISIIKKGPLFYLVRKDNENINQKKLYYNKIDEILNNISHNSKGYIYEEFVLLFLKDIGFTVCEYKKTDDGGLDIICSKNIDSLFTGINIKFNLYGQVKFHKTLVSTKYIKQLIKDKLFKTIIEKNTLSECEMMVFISHKGFSERAKSYANENRILLLDTRDILSIIFKQEKYNSLKYIDNEFIKMKAMYE